MLDALSPAAEAARVEADREATLTEVLTAAALASERGATATADMRAASGRARHCTGRSRRNEDPGAVTISLMLGAWAEVVSGARVDPGLDAQEPGLSSPGPTGLHATRRSAPRPTSIDSPPTSGQFAILALDHVRSFATTVRPDDPDSLSADDIVSFKEELIHGIGVDASALLVDPALALGDPRRHGDPSVAGVLVGIEDGDYESAVVSPRSLPGWTVERAARLGADGIKISVYFDDDGDIAVPVRLRSRRRRQCAEVDLPLFCEPLVHRRDGIDMRDRVIDGVRLFGDLGVDVLKIQFPSDTTTRSFARQLGGRLRGGDGGSVRHRGPCYRKGATSRNSESSSPSRVGPALPASSPDG